MVLTISGTKPVVSQDIKFLCLFVKTHTTFKKERGNLRYYQNAKEDTMKMQHITVPLTVINLALMTFLLAKMRPVKAQQKEKSITPVLRARALEIVDSKGRVRASITLQPPVKLGGKKYPQTVLL